MVDIEHGYDDLVAMNLKLKQEIEQLKTKCNETYHAAQLLEAERNSFMASIRIMIETLTKSRT